MFDYVFHGQLGPVPGSHALALDASTGKIYYARPGTPSWTLIGASIAPSDLAPTSVGLFLSGVSIDFTQANSITSNAVIVPSPGLPGSGGLFSSLGQHADSQAANGYGFILLMFGQVDNTAGVSSVTIPQGGLGLINIPAAWVQVISPSSVVTTIPAGGTGQIQISQYMFIPAGAVIPTAAGNVKLTLNPAQSAKLQLHAYAIGVPLLNGLNPLNISPTVSGIFE